MPMWCPPTPPQQDSDVYVDHTAAFLYEPSATAEHRLPACARSGERRDAKRQRVDGAAPASAAGRPPKMARRDDPGAAPASLFHSPAVLKMRRDLRLQRYRGGGGRAGAAEQPPLHEWTVHEDAAILKVLQGCQRLPVNLAVMSPAHTPNWDFVADYVNTVSITYRAAKQCRARYEGVLMAREEGKALTGAAAAAVEGALRKKKAGGNKSSGMPGAAALKLARPARTAHLLAHDNNSTFTQVAIERYDALRSAAGKRQSSGRSTGSASTAPPAATASPPQRTRAITLSTSAPALDGIDMDHPVMPVEVAAKRAERIAKEKRVTHEQLAKLQQLRQGSPAAPGTPPAAPPRPPRIPVVAAQTTTTTATVVSAATQRLIVSAAGGAVKQAAQLQLVRQGAKQLRLQPGAIGGQQQALAQFAQQQRQAAAAGVARTATEGEVAQLLRKQKGAVAQPVATLVKAAASAAVKQPKQQTFSFVPSVGQTVTIPVSLASSSAAGAGPQQLRQLHAQLLAQKLAASQKQPSTQLVYGAAAGGGRPLQLQQLVRAPAGAPLVLARGGAGGAARLAASPRPPRPQALLQQVAGARAAVGMAARVRVPAAAVPQQQQPQPQQQQPADAQVSRFVKRQ